MEIRRAGREEAALITQQSIRAFDSDVAVGNKDMGGPPEYDSEKWHREMAQSKHLFTVLEDDAIIGAAILFRDKNIMYVGRVFLDPKFHRKGLGTKMMQTLETMFPDAPIWRLDTPIWNIRTNSFYQKLGYKEVKRDKEFIYYEKRI